MTSRRKIGYCDSCMFEKAVRRISLGHGAGAHFCDACLRKEVKWRKQRNMTLNPSAKFRTKYKYY